MSAEELIRNITHAGFLLLFLTAGVRAVRTPRMVNVLVLCFFAIAAAVIALDRATDLWLTEPLDEWVLDLQAILILLFPLSMLLLANTFMSVRRRYVQASVAGLIASIAVVLLTADDNAGPWVLIPFAYFLLTQGYVSVRFVAAARHTTGLARKRLLAVSVGAAMLVVIVALAIPAGLLSQWAGLWASLASVAGLAAGLAFFAGFAPPAFLKSAWQSAEIRRFLTDWPAGGWVAASSREAFASEVQDEARRILGSEMSVLWLWDDEHEALVTPATPPDRVWPGGNEAAARTYASGEPLLEQVTPTDPTDDRRGFRIMAPISRGEARCGVISGVGRNATAFVEDDLWVLTLLADHIALALEHNELLARLSEARAREEADELKEDFLSAVAHDLQTPLTTVLGEAQLMERRARLDPSRPADAPRLGRLIEDAQRMRRLVRDLIDFSRADRVSLVTEREPVDVAALVRRVAAGLDADGRLDVETPNAAVVFGDEARLAQLVDNLVQNALKYSAPDTRVAVTVEADDLDVRLSVTDHGIGIAPEDLPFVFDRFWRSRRIDDRHYAGIGLGLYICRRITEDHGGSISVSSLLGVGSTFTVVLPCAVASEPHPTEEVQWPTPTS